MSEMLAANISNIQHFNVHDGTGLRTTIFFQGCGLRCAWCQNPELLSMEPVMMFSEQLCTHCMACTEACPTGALAWADGVFSYDASLCTHCGRCEEACYFLARSFSSHPMTVVQVFKESTVDELFYRGGWRRHIERRRAFAAMQLPASLAATVEITPDRCDSRNRRLRPLGKLQAGAAARGHILL